MNQIQLFDIALKVVPTYDGDVNSLYRFISAASSVADQYYDRDNPDNFQNVIVTNGIIGKLQGKALEIIDINGARNWDEIKDVLIQNFADQRDENSLNRDLINLHQNNETPQHYYDRCLRLLNTIINYVNLHNDDAEVISCKRSFFTTQTLKTFLAGLKEPLGSTIRAMRPSSLPEALQFIKEESNTLYLQKRNQNNSFANNQNKFEQQKSTFTNTQRFPVPVWNRNKPYTQRPGFSQVQPHFSQNRSNILQNNPNAFYQDPRTYRAPRPVPMSGVSHGNATNNIPRPGNNTTANAQPRFVPFQNNSPQQAYANRQNTFQNIGYYPDYQFEELHQHETLNEPEVHDLPASFESEEMPNPQIAFENENENFYLGQDSENET